MLRVTYMGEFIGEVPLVVRTGITADGGLTVLDRVGQLMRTPFFTAILIAVAVCALIYVFGTAISRSRKKTRQSANSSKRTATGRSPAETARITAADGLSEPGFFRGC